MYWQALDVDAEGNVVEQRLGNGVTTRREHDPATGLVERIDTWLPGQAAGDPAGAQRLVYVFDALGNLNERRDERAGLVEAFDYDGHNRLVSAQVGTNPALTMTYDGAGNIVSRSDVTGTYLYGPGKSTPGSTAGGPSAVTSANGNAYAYDANGNLSTVTDAHCDACSPWCSNTIRTARSRTSGENLVCLLMAPSSQGLEPPGIPARFRQAVSLVTLVAHNL